jgi:hypothetical protein
MKDVILVVGMHRSGTSCLAGSLQESGLELGDVVTQARHNPKGNRENLRIMKLHDAVLAANGGAWDEPPARVCWTDAQRRDRDAIMDDYVGVARWGFKDPRTLLTLDGWLEVLERVRFVGSLRHPRAVATSLQRRNGGPLGRWLDLWAVYNERLLALHEQQAFPIVDFGVDDATYREALRLVIDQLGLAPSASQAFFDPELRHHLFDDAELPPRVRELYAELRSRTVRPSGSPHAP